MASEHENYQALRAASQKRLSGWCVKHALTIGIYFIEGQQYSLVLDSTQIETLCCDADNEIYYSRRPRDYVPTLAEAIEYSRRSATNEILKLEGSLRAETQRITTRIAELQQLIREPRFRSDKLTNENRDSRNH